MIAGYAWELSESISLKPTTLVKMTNGAPLEVDLTAQVVFKTDFGLRRLGDPWNLQEPWSDFSLQIN